MHHRSALDLLQSNENPLWWSNVGAKPAAHNTSAMSPFQFQAVQTLDIASEDQPNIDVQNGKLILTAMRGGDQIRITAPLNSVIPTIATKATTVKPAARSVRKGRTSYTRNVSRGENSGQSKLTEVQVREIKSLVKDMAYRKTYPSAHAMLVDIGKTYNVHYTTIYSIYRGATWKHVEV